MLELHFQPVVEGSQPFSRDEICETVLGRWPGYSKDLGWGPKPKSWKSTSVNSSSTYEQEMHSREVNELASLENANRLIEEQQRTSKLHAWQMEESALKMKENARKMEKMRKMIEEMS